MRSLYLLLVLFFLVAVPAQHTHAQEARCFAETPHCVAGALRAFWEQRGGLAVFGLPLSPARHELVAGEPALVQWFERARLELPAGASAPAQVRIGRLGAELLAAQGRPWREALTTSAPALAGCRHFPATGYHLCGPLLAAWQSLAPDEAGRLALLGLPISAPRTETLADGRAHTVQWFERARIELHPALPAPFDLQFGRLGAELLAAAPPPPADLAGGAVGFETSRGLDRALFPAADPHAVSYLATISPAGSQRRALSRNHIQRDEAPAWSPDGRRVAFHSPRAGGLPEIYLLDADGANLTRLTFNTAADAFPAWSPDGSRIAFASERDGNWEIYLMAADGSGQTNLSRSPGSTDRSPAWSPDGSRIAFRSARFGADDEIVVIAADGSGQTNLSRAPSSDEAAPAWSPDGQWLAFESNRDGNREIYRVALDGSQLLNLSRHPAGDYAPAWSPDGRWLLFETDRDGNREIYRMRADGSDQMNLTRSPDDERQPQWGAAPAPGDERCPGVPEPIHARVEPQRCVHAGQELAIQLFGFLAGSRFEYRVSDPGGQRSPPLVGGYVDERGELAGIRFPAGSLAPGLWRFEFTFFAGSRSFHDATVYVHVSANLSEP